MKIAIVTDSGSGLTKQQAGELGIYYLPLQIIIQDKMFLDGENITVEEIYEYLCANYRQPFSLTELSRQFSFHPAYITRCIKKKYQLTPLQLLTRIRIEEAQKDRKSTRLNSSH